jgi:hypothetical protein
MVVSSYHCFSLIFHQIWRWAYINIKNPCLEFSIKYLETLSNVYLFQNINLRMILVMYL